MVDQALGFRFLNEDVQLHKIFEKLAEDHGG
jgi:hypothetical protein